MRNTTLALAALIFLSSLTPGISAIKTQEIDYKEDGTALRGFLAYDDAQKGKRPGVLVVHEWWGHNQHARNQAVKLAKAGYVGFALDMYGKGKVTTHPKDANAYMEEVMKAPDLLKARFQTAYDLLKKRPEVDPERIAAIGYCFGGTVALTMARAGADLKAVATFHAGLKPAAGPAQPGQVKAKILVMTGGADQMIPPDQVQAFKDEMSKAGAHAEVKVYPGARHSFTNPDAGKAGMDNLKYDAKVAEQSWDDLMKFLPSALGK